MLSICTAHTVQAGDAAAARAVVYSEAVAEAVARSLILLGTICSIPLDSCRGPSVLESAGVDCGIADLGRHSKTLDAVGTGSVVHPVGRDRDLAGLGGSSLVERAGRNCSRLGFVAESHRRECSGVVEDSHAERVCHSRFGAEKWGTVRKLVAGGVMVVVDRMLRWVEAGMTGLGLAGHRQVWRIDWTVGRGRMVFVDCSHLVGGCTGCLQIFVYLVGA